MWLLYLFFSLMLLCPTLFQFQRGILLLLLLLAGILKLKKGCHINKRLNSIALIAITTSCFFIFWGVCNGAPGAIKITSVYVMWPILYFIFIATCSNYKTIYMLMKTFIYVGILVCLMNLLLLINASILHVGLLSNLAESLNVGFGLYDGYIEFSSPSLSVAPLLFYFTFSLFVLNEKHILVSNKTLIIAIIVSLITILFSGRRAFWLMIPVAPFVIYLFCTLAKYRTRKLKFLLPVSFFLALILLFAIVIFFDYQILYETFISSFDFEEDLSNSIRAEQYIALVDRWIESPLIGHGLGAYAPQCIRSEISVWSYELSYLALLMNVGIIGFILYSFCTGWIFIKSFAVIRKNNNNAIIVLPFISSLFLILCLHASNPYLTKFDYMWPLFIPVLILNTIYCKQKSQSL